jgi:hypothetical protein
MLCSFKTNLTLVIAGLCLLGATSANAINVMNADTVTEAQMTTALTGTGVTISNLTITNPGNCTNYRRGVGIFTNGTTAAGAGPVLSEPTGVVVANSDFANAANALDTANNAANTTNTLCNGTTSDADMVTLLAGTSNGEYASIQFDVVPNSTTLAIPFQFGSEEFPEYVCSIYTDIVGIFVSGPGITSSTPTFSSPSPGFPYENYAKTSSGYLSSINWLNTGVPGINASNVCTNAAGGGSLSNAAFYTDNSNGSTTGGNGTVATTNANLEVDGFTNTLYQPITVVAGQTYHVKIAVADSQDRTYDSAAFIHPIFSTGSFSGFDYGDAPNNYGTLTSSAGPSHGIDNSIYMGTVPDSEITGFPSVGADGDDLNGVDDEDGIASFPVLPSNATSYSVNVNVTNNSGNPAKLVGWIDFNGNGTFESTEGTQTIVATGTTGATVSLNWSGLSGLVTGDTFARFRFSSDINLSVATTGSAMSDGEVEDYTLPISGVTFTKYVSTDPVCADTLQTLNAYVGSNVYYCYTVTNPNASAFTITASSDDQGHDISALQVAYAPAASNTVIIGPLIAGGAELPTGVTTVNNASVTANIAGSSVIVNDSASVTVTAIPPASGMKQLYFETVTPGGNLTRDPTDSITDSTSANIAKNGGTLTLNQGIVFTAAKPFTITGGNDLIVKLRVRRTSNSASDVQVEVFNGNTGSPIGAAVSSSITAARNVWQTLTLTIPAASIPVDVTLANNDYIQLLITNITTGGGGARNIQVRTLEDVGGGVIEKSQLQIESSTVINVDSIGVYANPWPDTTQYSSYTPGSTVYIRATASDPFGSADITSATITIDDPNSPPSLINNAAMTSVATPTSTTRLFQYAYNIPASPEGFWPLSVTANEGFEATVFHTALSTMIVGTPNITISKNSAVLSDPINASNPKAIPGAIIEYSINVENSGFGYVDNNSTIVSDPVPAGTTFYFGSPLNPATFIDGATASGLSFTFIDLSSTVDDIEFSNDGGSTFITPTVDANGYDTTSPPINFIRIIPKGEFNGSDSVNNPSMQVDFRVRVD